MSLVSRTAQYALRAMSLLAGQPGRTTVRQLATQVGAPQPYLARIIMTLADKKLVDARRGPGGGLKLARRPNEITLMEIISCFDGHGLSEECCLGLPACSDRLQKCPIHGKWTQIRLQILDWWKVTTLEDISIPEIADCRREQVESHPEAFLSPHRARGHWD